LSFILLNAFQPALRALPAIDAALPAKSLAWSSDIFGNGNSSSASYSGYNIRDQASDLAGNAASMAGSALSAGWNAFNKMKDNYS
jgi:hypothetical protein